MNTLLSRRGTRIGVAVALAICAFVAFGYRYLANGSRWAVDREEAHGDESDEIQTAPNDADEMANTTVTPHLQAPIVPGKNAIYCATFQIAWDRLKKNVIGEPVQLAGTPELASELNRSEFPLESLSGDTYVALAGTLAGGLKEEARSRMKTKFPGASARLLPQFPNANPDDIAVYVYLQKLLRFAHEFDRLDRPHRFHAETGDVQVAAFGLEDFHSHLERENELRGQASVIDYNGLDDFLIELRSKGDRIVLAKIPRPATLAEALETVRKKRPRKTPKEILPGERLEIPVLSLFVVKQYDELTKRQILNAEFTSKAIVDARQLIRFRLDEAGAVLESEAIVEAATEDDESDTPLRQFIFDRPFLIYLEQDGAEAPYFIMWVENGEVLSPAG